MKKLSRVSIAVIASAFAVAACGGGESGGSAESTDIEAAIKAIDACALLTAAEVEAATGIAPGTPVDPGHAAPACNWPTADGSNPSMVTMVIGASSNSESFESAMVEWEESASAMEMPFDREDYEKVEAGDFGAWLREAQMLQVQHGYLMIALSARVAADRDSREASIQLANNALGRID